MAAILSRPQCVNLHIQYYTSLFSQGIKRHGTGRIQQEYSVSAPEGLKINRTAMSDTHFL